MQNVKYGQRIADAYPVGGTWVTARNNDNPFRTWGPSENSLSNQISFEWVEESEWALILYTCTYSGQERIAVCCERMIIE